MDNHVGFSGTRHGMTMPQIEAVTSALQALRASDGETWFHHGDCVGADAQAHEIAKSLGFRIHVHPPLDTKLRAFCGDWDKTEKPKHYRARNTDIVRMSMFVILTPLEDSVMLSSGLVGLVGGTWMTYGIAERLDKGAILVMSDGRVLLERVEL